jgi:hypothetical protein
MNGTGTAFIRIRLRSGRSQVGISNMTKKKLPYDLVEIRMQQPQKNTADPVVSVLTMILTADISKGIIHSVRVRIRIHKMLQIRLSALALKTCLETSKRNNTYGTGIRILQYVQIRLSACMLT